MKSMLRISGTLALLVILGTRTIRSQNLGDELQKIAKIGSAAVEGYVKPFASGLGNGLNTSIYHSADLHGIFGFDFQLKLGLVQVRDEDKMYDLTMPSSLTVQYEYAVGLPPASVTFSSASGDYDAVYNAPTAAGDADGVLIATKQAKQVLVGGIPVATIPSGYKLASLPKGLGVSLPGAAALQGAIGLPFGLEVMGRFLPTYKIGDAGSISMSGFGIRYDIDQWIPLFPIDIAAHFMTQNLSFKGKGFDGNETELLSATATAYGLEASKSLVFLTLYAGFQLENSTIKVPDITGLGFGGQSVTAPGFEVNGSNSSRVTVGLRMLLLFLNVHAEYSLATEPVLGLGVGISFR